MDALRTMPPQSLEPPSTWTVWPVIQRASSQARKATTGAMSSGWATRFSACMASVTSRPGCRAGRRRWRGPAWPEGAARPPAAGRRRPSRRGRRSCGFRRRRRRPPSRYCCSGPTPAHRPLPERGRWRGRCRARRRSPGRFFPRGCSLSYLLKRALLAQEVRDVADEAPRVLVLGAVAGVRIDDQLSVGDVLLQNPGVDGVDDHVVVAVDYQRRLQDGLEVLVGTLTLHAPLADCLDLGGRHFLARLRVA